MCVHPCSSLCHLIWDPNIFYRNCFGVSMLKRWDTECNLFTGEGNNKHDLQALIVTILIEFQ